MRTLVTGGAGFIGSHLVQRLWALGDEVVVVDDLSSGALENLSGLLEEPRVRVIVGDAADPALLEDALVGCGRVVHLAAAVGVRRVLERTVETIESNTRTIRAVLSAAGARRLRILVASSSEVYGPTCNAPFREEDAVVLGATTSPRWAYACAKALDEWLALAWWREQGLPVTVVRFFNAVGPRQSGRYGMVVPRFVDQALRGAPLTVHGDGAQTRCFSHVRDTVEAVLRLLETDAAIGEVVNVGAVREVRILDLARLVLARTGSASPIVITPLDRVFGVPFEDPARRVPDVSKLARLTGFVPSTPIEQIVDDVIAYLRGIDPARSGVTRALAG